MTWLNPEVDGLDDGTGAGNGTPLTMGGINSFGTTTFLVANDPFVDFFRSPQPYDQVVEILQVEEVTIHEAIPGGGDGWKDPGGRAVATLPSTGIIYPRPRNVFGG